MENPKRNTGSFSRVKHSPQDIVTDINKFRLNLGLVVLDDGHLLWVTLLLNAGDNTPRGTTRPNHILVGDRQEVTFFDRQLLRLLGNFLPAKLQK